MSEKLPNSELSEQINRLLPLKMDELTPELIEKAKVELNETPEKRQEGLKKLKCLISTEKDFHPCIEESYLLRFLRVRKFNTEAAFQTLKNFYFYKTCYSGILTDIYPSEMKHIIHMNLLEALRFRDHQGCVVPIAKLCNFDLQKTTLDELIILYILGAEFYLQSEVTQICGFSFILNFQGTSLSTIRHLASPTTLYRFIKMIKDGIPARIKAIHIVYEPFFFTVFFNIVRRLLTEKLKNRIQVHGNNLENLHKQIPPEILPRDFGGQLDPMTSKGFANDILDKDNYFSHLYKYGYNGQKAEMIRKKNNALS